MRTPLKTPHFLVLLLSLAYLPFLPFRVIRMAGDEKVYLAQSLEMIERGSWFLQTLTGVPEYFKGPLHFWLVRVGHLIFGDSLLTGLWMNFVLLLAGALAVYAMTRRHWSARRAFLFAGATGLNIGVYAHSFSSQMEVELCAVYLFMLALLGWDSKISFKRDVMTWLLIGATAWIKSPFYSVILSFTTLLFWTWSGTLLPRVRELRFWITPLFGVLTGVSAYLPILWNDFENFWAIFVVREQFNKPNNGWPWYAVLTPLIHFAIPWLFFLLSGLFSAFRSVARGQPLPVLVKLGISFALPVMLIWSSWSYKGQNYNLPILSSLLLIAFQMLPDPLPKRLARGMGALGGVAFVGWSVILFRFSPLPEWWSMTWVILSLSGFLVFAVSWLWAKHERMLALGALGFFVAFSSVAAPLGERELVDLTRARREYPEAKWIYGNIFRNIFNEWALMQLATGEKFYWSISWGEIKRELHRSRRVAILATMEQEIREFREVLTREGYTFREVPWRRWMTKGRSPDGKPMWKLAWNERDLSLLERNYTIFVVEPHPTDLAPF